MHRWMGMSGDGDPVWQIPHNPSSTQTRDKQGTPGEGNSVCSSGVMAEAERQADIFTGASSSWRSGYTLPLPLQACGPEQPTSFCVLSPAVAPPAVPGTQYVYRYSPSESSRTSPPQPVSSSIFHNYSCSFHPIFMIFSNSIESLLLLLAPTYMSFLIFPKHIWGNKGWAVMIPSFWGIPGDYEVLKRRLLFPSCFMYFPSGILPGRVELTRWIVIIMNVTGAITILTFKSIYAPVVGLQS